MAAARSSGDESSEADSQPQPAPPVRRAVAVWIAAVGIAPVVVSSVYALAGPAIRTTFHLSYDRWGLLAGASMLGYGLTALAGGVLLDLIAVAPLARATLLFAAAACVAGGIAPAWGALAATMVVFGAAAGVLAVLPLVFFSDLYPRDRARTMARWQLAISFAAVLLPLAVGVLLAATGRRFGVGGGWRALLFGCAPLFLILLALAPGRSLGRRPVVESLTLERLAEVARRPMFAALLIIGMLHTAADNSTYVWIVMLVKQRFHAGPDMTGVLAASYGLAYTVGRLVRSTLPWPWRPLPTIAGGSLVGAVILGFALRADTLAAVIGLYAAAGIFFSLNWPSTLGYASERFPARTGTVLGAVNAVTGPGTVVVSLVVGVVSQHGGGVSTGMLILPALFLSLSVFAAAAHRRSRRFD